MLNLENILRILISIVKILTGSLKGHSHKSWTPGGFESVLKKEKGRTVMTYVEKYKVFDLELKGKEEGNPYREAVS